MPNIKNKNCEDCGEAFSYNQVWYAIKSRCKTCWLKRRKRLNCAYNFNVFRNG